AAPGAAPTNAASPAPASSTTDTGNKPPTGPIADPPKTPAVAQYTNNLMQNRPMDALFLQRLRAESWYTSKIPGTFSEPDNLTDLTVRYGGRASDYVAEGATAVWGGLTYGKGWGLGGAITDGGRMAIDGIADGDPVAVMDAARKLMDVAADMTNLSDAVADMLDDTPTPSGDVTQGDGPVPAARHAGPEKDSPKATAPYKRPSGATTPQQRASVQGQPCVDCGAVTPKQVADHKTPLVK